MFTLSDFIRSNILMFHCGCLENSDLENSDPRPEKLRPSGVSKTQTQKLRPSGCLENSDPKNETYLYSVNAASRLVYCSSIQWHYHHLPRKEKNSLQCYIRATIMKIILNICTYFSFRCRISQVYIHNVSCH